MSGRGACDIGRTFHRGTTHSNSGWSGIKLNTSRKSGDTDNVWGSWWRRAVVWIVGLSAIAFGIVTLYLSLHSLYWYPRVYALWVIAPPGWFFVEYYFIFDRRDDPHALELIKIGQDVAQKFWAALLVLLAGIGYFQWHLSVH
jgi:hypothetical protein